VSGVDATTNGTIYFDAFESRRSTYIGPIGGGTVTTTVTYLYDSLYRLKQADYSTGEYFIYSYDAVGNRLTQTICLGAPTCTPVNSTYAYDESNRLLSVNGVAYTWDNNGNLLNDGTNTYVYDAANRLTSVTGGGNTSTYTYNGLGDRLSQTVNAATTSYVLDTSTSLSAGLNAGLTQVLSDGNNTYLYGAMRIGELQAGGMAYHLGDALGSVRQLWHGGNAKVTLARKFSNPNEK
jgi:YD repeat-containing protein